MGRVTLKEENVKYIVKRHFGTKTVADIIMSSVENICKSAICLTTVDPTAYNIFGSVEEVKDENR